LPFALLRQYSGRVPLVHLKDRATDRRFATVGDGTLDMRAICATATCATATGSGVRVYVVENGQPRLTALESAHRSRENMRTLGLT